MYDPAKRLYWDKSVKNIQIIRSEDNFGLVVHIHYDSPMFLIDERDLVDKYMNFFHNGVFYSLSSSVGDDIYAPVKDVIRCRNYMSLFSMYDDEEYFYFIAFNQADVKVKIYLI
jgi:hypothetical protein